MIISRYYRTHGNKCPFSLLNQPDDVGGGAEFRLYLPLFSEIFISIDEYAN